METENRKNYLIFKYINKSLSIDEKLEINDLLDNDSQFAKDLYEIALTAVTIQSSLELAFEKKQELDKQKKRKIIKLTILSAAALMLIFLGLNLFYVLKSNNQKTEIAKIKKRDITFLLAVSRKKNDFIEKGSSKIIKLDTIFFHNDKNKIDNNLLAEIDLEDLFPKRTIMDSVDYYINNKNYEKAIQILESIDISKCENYLEIGKIALIALQINSQDKKMMQTADKYLKYSANLNNCYKEQRVPALLLLSYLSIFQNDPKKSELYLDTILQINTEDKYTEKANKLRKKLKVRGKS